LRRHYLHLSISSLFSFLPRRPPSSTLFPYTTLFRSHRTEHSRSRAAPVRQVGARSSKCSGAEILPMTRHKSRPARSSSSDTSSQDRKSTRLNSSHVKISYAVFCLKKKTNKRKRRASC